MTPFLALVPVPILSTITEVSPPGIKVLLGGQAEVAIRGSTIADLRQTS